MAGLTVRPDALDYLAGLSLSPAEVAPRTAWAVVPPDRRRLDIVTSIGTATSDDDQAADVPPTEGLLAGLAGERIPMAFVARGRPDGVRFAVGTWAHADEYLDQQHEVVTSMLDGLYPSVERVRAEHLAFADLPVGGLSHGVAGGQVRDGEAPWDRLLRSLQGLDFAVVALAEPIEATTVAQLRDIALDDARSALSADAGLTTPLTRAYVAHIEELVESLNRGLSIGAWRTGVYLLGDAVSYWRLAAAWRATFSDASKSLPPLRVETVQEAAQLADGWVLPYSPAPRGPRGWHHPFLNQTLMDTRQMASFIHFPRLDTPGFSVRRAPQFSVSRTPPKNPARAVHIGDVMAHRRKTGTTYAVDVDQLTRHALVVGLTGSGKTNTLMHVLDEITSSEIPFLVIEPAKTEYRELLARAGLRDRLRVFTIGRENVAPLRMNPFEVVEGIDVSTHLDLLKAVFQASFALWIPLPQVLEQCLVQLYTERGWDFATGRARHGAAADVPTLAELVESVQRTVPTLGYKPESTQEITASLVTRLNSLRRGTRGLMLDVERSIPMAELLREPTVIELEGLGDDADKAFVMGLLLVRLYEHRRAHHAAQLAAAAAAGEPAPPSGRLSHLVIVEEAHRLLSATKKHTDSWNADPQGAFSDAFSQMLSEVRAYGQGIVIADQVPVRLAPDVIKNTNVKIVHRLVAGDDRGAMAGAMSMDDEQSKILATLPVGRAAVFSEGDHTPAVVAVKKAKDLEDSGAIDDAAVAAAMTRWRANPDVAAYFEEGQLCSGLCSTIEQCREARSLSEEPAARVLAARLLTTALAHADGFDVVWPDVAAFVHARTPSREDAVSAVRAFAVHALQRAIARRATQALWEPDDAVLLSSLAADVVAERAESPAAWLGETKARRRLMEAAAGLLRRSHDPYPLCSSVCDDGSCVYRDPVADVLLTPRHVAVSNELAGQPDQGAYAMQVGGYAANDIVATSPDAPAGAAVLNGARWRALACAAQVKFCAVDHPRDAAAIIAKGLSTAGWSVSVAPATGGPPSAGDGAQVEKRRQRKSTARTTEEK